MRRFFLVLSLFAALPSWAGPAEILAAHAARARQENPAFTGFSATAGERFYHTKGESGVSCASCHTDDPRAEGRHRTTGRAIAPIAPAANRERLSDAAKVEKWFARNCRDARNRACTTQEKGDFIAYLLSIK
jgi:mono/diheme cytochrome c family protein